MKDLVILLGLPALFFLLMVLNANDAGPSKGGRGPFF
jgi:hypothetical protein